MRTDITWTDDALKHFEDVRSSFELLRMYYGPALADEHEAEFLRTFVRVTFAAGPVRVAKDGDGFYITTPHIVIGLVWTPDTDDRLVARVAESCGITPVAVDDDFPRTGHWSAHS